MASAPPQSLYPAIPMANDVVIVTEEGLGGVVYPAEPLPPPVAPSAFPPKVATNANEQNESSSALDGSNKRCCSLKFFCLVMVLVVAGTIVGMVVSGGNGKEGGHKTQLVVVNSHNTKLLWMDEMVTAFNQAKLTFQDSKGNTRPVRVKVCHTGADLLEYPCGDELRATVWSPPNSVWVERNFLETPDASYVKNPEECVDTTNIPIGIAMWRDMAEALGWPDKDLGWEDILDLVLQPDGWDSVPGANAVASGYKFLYGHGHPVLSNSGSLSWVSTVHAFAGVSADGQLTSADIFDPQVQNQTAALSRAVMHMGKIDTDILDRMVLRGESYLHAVANYESNVIRYNNILESQGKSNRFVLIYPKDGTFWQTHPLCALDGPGSSWVTQDDHLAARVFTEFVTETRNQEKLCQFGIRPINEIAGDNCLDKEPFTFANGVIPASPTIIPKIINPSPNVVNDVVDMWLMNRKPVKWTLVLDQSGSMSEDNNIAELRQAAALFVSEMLDIDYLKIVGFSSEVEVIVPWGELGGNRQEANRAIGGMVARGGTELRPAVRDTVLSTEQVLTQDRGRGEDFSYGIVVMTDGDDTSLLPVSTVYDVLPEGVSSSELHIFSVAFGRNVNGENQDFLSQIAIRTNGKFFSAEKADLQLTFTYIQAEL